jgi:hypothetical protein
MMHLWLESGRGMNAEFWWRNFLENFHLEEAEEDHILTLPRIVCLRDK